MKSATAYLVLLAALVAAAAAEGGSYFPKFTSNEYHSRKRDAGSGIPGGFFGPGSGFGSIPGWTNAPWSNPGGGYGAGAGYGGDDGGQSRNGIGRSPVVCKEKGPCFNKELTCPARCFQSYSRSGKYGGAGGGGGSCYVDCKKKCVASC